MESPTKRLKFADPGQYEQVDTGSSSSAPAPVPADIPPGQHSDPLLSPNNLLALAKRVFQNSRLMSRPLTDPDVVDARPFAPGTNTHNDQSRQGPEIQFGEGAQAPRWLVEPLPQSQQPQRNNDQLVRDHSDLQAVEHASQSNPRMVMLAWKFDAGPPSNWKNLTAEQLYEYAHKYLENSLDNPFFRDHVRLAINAGPYAAAVADVEDPLPPLPTAPLTNFFGPPLGFANIFNYGSHMYSDHRRPSTTVRKGIYRSRSIPDDRIIIDSPRIGGRSPSDTDDTTIIDSPRIARMSPSFDSESGLDDDQQITVNDENLRPPTPYEIEEQPPRPPTPENPPSNGLLSADPEYLRQAAITKQTGDREGDPKNAHKYTTGKYANNSAFHAKGTTWRKSKTKSKELEGIAIDYLKGPKTRARHFPIHVFRRMRPWAGCKISEESINKNDLDKLPQFPTAIRAFQPRAKVAPLILKNGVLSKKKGGSKKSSPPLQSPRRNPRRNCRDSK